MALSDLRKNDMMAHLLDALEQSKDIGHYGRLVFAMVARHFISDAELVKLLTKDKRFDEEQARTLVAQVQSRDYNPPKRQKIMEFLEQQKFPICPNADDPVAHTNLGIALLYSGDRAAAVAEFEQALKLNADLPLAKQGLEQARKPAPK